MADPGSRRRASKLGGLRSMWGPQVSDARWLWSERVLELVATRVDATPGEIADDLLSMRTQRRYLLLAVLGETRQAVVFAAVDQLLAREVALKVLRDDDGDVDNQLCWQLIAEMQVMTRFDHPHLVRALDFGVHDGWPYVVMELCDGDLEAWAPGRPWREVLARLIEAGRGLEAMHAAGFVHGDVKPENVMLVDGVAKLGDLGLAGRPGLSTRVRGTAGYMAPEVAEAGRELASDVFSFACMVWTALFDRPPFGGPPPTASTSAAVFVQVERARAGQLDFDATRDRGLPSVLVTLLRPALVADPSARPTIAELLAELESMLAPRGLRHWLRARLSTGPRR